MRRWYSRHLRAMHEPSLSCDELPRVEAYRFLWLRSFHAPVSVRVQHIGSQYVLDAVVLNGAGGYAPGDEARRVHKTISSNEWTQITNAIDQVHFWGLPTEGASAGNDGAQWIVEGRTDRYHVVDRWGGEENAQVGRLLLTLAGLKDNVGPIY